MTISPPRHRKPVPAAPAAPAALAAPARPAAAGATLRYRLDVAARALAAIGGGYAMAALAAATLALDLPGARVDSALAGTLAGLLVYPCTALWAFAARSAVRAWLALLLAGAVLAALQALAAP